MKVFERHRGDFAVTLRELASAKPTQRFATPAKAIDEIMRKGFGADICVEGARYNASFNEVDGRILATRGQFNPLIRNAQQAIESMRAGEEEFYLTDEVLLGNKPATKVLLEIAEQDAKKPIYVKRVIDLGQTKTYNVPTDCFGDDDTIVFLAESKTRANKYGLWLRNGLFQTKESEVRMQDLVGKNKSRGFFLTGMGRPVFDCDSKGLYEGAFCSLFGVYEDTSQKKFALCKKQAKTYLNILERVISGKDGTSKLEKVARFFRQH